MDADVERAAVPRAVIGLGGSAGGVDAMRRVVAALPADLPTALCLVLHISASARSYLADVLTRETALPVSAARGGEPLEPGRIFVAPPDFHLLVGVRRVGLSHGPNENSARPAVDPLFRSLAAAFGRRAIATARAEQAQRRADLFRRARATIAGRPEVAEALE